MKTIGCDELAQELRTGSSDVWLVCTLGAWGFGTGHIPGSLSLATPEQARAALAPDANVVVYGRDEGDPAPTAAAVYLARHGHRRVRVLAGGLAAWAAAGLPLDAPPVTAPHSP